MQGREIQFMAWDEVNKRMFFFEPGFGWHDEYNLWYLIADETMQPYSHTCDVPFHEEISLLQFTGILDKKNQKVYEGFICRDDAESIWVVKFIDGSFWFCNPADPSNRNTYDWLKENGFWKDGYTIIGNIFQHHELLKIK